MADVADLFITLRAETAPFLAGMRTAGEEGESFTARMGGLSGVLNKVGAATTAVGVGVAVASIKMAGDFQANMTKLTTTAGESQANLQMVSDGVKKVAVDTGTSTKELADGMYMVESAGFHGKEGLEVLRVAAQGARAEQAPLAEVTNAVTSALKSYHMGADQSTTITNQMIAAVGHGKMTFGEFAGSLSTVLPIAASAGLKFEEVGGAIATLTNHGTSAQEATQELANAIRNLQAPNNVAIQEMQRLGVSSVDVQTHLGERGITGTLQMLQQAILSKMGPAGTVLLSTFNTSKQAADDANKMIQSMPPSLQKLATEFQQGKISVGDWRQQLKTLPVDQANLASQFATLVNKSEGFNAELKRGGPAAQTYDEAMKKMMGGSTGLNAALMLGGENMADFESNVKAVGAAAEHGGKNVHGWEDIQKTFNFQMSQLKERLETAAITIGTKLIPVVLQVINFFREHKAVAEALAAVIGTVLTAAVVSFATGAVVGAVKGIADIGKGLKAATIAVRDFEIAQKLAAAASKIMAVAQAALNLVMDANPVVLIVIAIAALVAGLIYAYNHVSWFRAAVQVAFESVKQVAVMLWHALEAAWRGIVSGVTWLWHGIVSIWNSIASVTSSVWNAISAFFMKWWPLLLMIFAAPIGIMIAAWNHFHQAVFDIARTVWNAIAGFFTGIWNWITGVAQAAWALFMKYIVAPNVALFDFLSGLWDSVMHWFSGVWNSIGSAASSGWGLIRQYILRPVEQIWNDITGVFGKIGGYIWDALKSALEFVGRIGEQFINVGIDIVMGIVHGIEHAAGYLFSSLKNLANDALKSAKSFLGISSPSKVFAEVVGKWIPHGIAEGVDANAHVARDAVRSMSESLVTSPGAATTGLAIAGAGNSGVSGSGTTVINVTVQGSVLSERDLRDVMQEQMLRLGMRNSATYQPYARR